MQPVVEATLPNGIKTMTLSGGDTDVTRITLSWEGGQVESQSRAASELASQLLREGAGEMTGAEIADTLDFNGSWLLTDVSSHNNSLTLFALNRNLPLVLPVVVEMVNNPTFPDEALSAISEKLAAARATALERVTTRADEMAVRAFMGADHPAARRFTPEEMRQVSREDVILEHRRLKGTQAPVAFIAGLVTPETAACINQFLEKIDCNPLTHGTIDVIPAKGIKESCLLVDTMPSALQSSVNIGIPAIPRSNPDYETLRLVVTALGGYFGSRLMTSLREEQGLTYGISAGLLGHREGGIVGISCQCDNAYVDRVIKGIGLEIERLAAEPMDHEELTAVRRYAQSQLIGMLDTPLSMIDYYITQRQLLTPPDYFTRQQQAINSLTPEKIQDFARRYLLTPPSITVVAGAVTRDQITEK